MIDEVILRVGQTRTLDVQLGVGAITETVEVKATIAPADRVSAEASTAIDASQIAIVQKETISLPPGGY